MHDRWGVVVEMLQAAYAYADLNMFVPSNKYLNLSTKKNCSDSENLLQVEIEAVPRQFSIDEINSKKVSRPRQPQDRVRHDRIFPVYSSYFYGDLPRSALHLPRILHLPYPVLLCPARLYPVLQQQQQQQLPYPKPYLITLSTIPRSVLAPALPYPVLPCSAIPCPSLSYAAPPFHTLHYSALPYPILHCPADILIQNKFSSKYFAVIVVCFFI